MPTRQGGSPAKKLVTWPRRSVLRSTTSPAASTACTWNTCLARSSPTVVIPLMDGSPCWRPNRRHLAHRCRRGPSTPTEDACPVTFSCRDARSSSPVGNGSIDLGIFTSIGGGAPPQTYRPLAHGNEPERPSPPDSQPCPASAAIALQPCHGHRVAACRHRPVFARRADMPTSVPASSTWWRRPSFRSTCCATAIGAGRRGSGSRG